MSRAQEELSDLEAQAKAGDRSRSAVSAISGNPRETEARRSSGGGRPLTRVIARRSR